MGVRIEIRSTDQIIRERELHPRGKVQRYIDNAVLRYCDKYVPFRTGKLKQSGTIHTVIGSGVVKYVTPYAREQYYYNSGRGTQGTARGGLRGRLWFKRMKAVYKSVILDNARRLSGARRS